MVHTDLEELLKTGLSALGKVCFKLRVHCSVSNMSTGAPYAKAGVDDVNTPSLFTMNDERLSLYRSHSPKQSSKRSKKIYA